MTSTYRAMQVTPARTLELVARPTPRPAAGEALIAVDACGVCGADAADIAGADLSLTPPRVPGHEVVGRIIALGENVAPIWRIGQRVGVGRKGGHCLQCELCRRGLFHLCTDQPVLGATCDGGYAEMLLVRGTALVSIPDAFGAAEAAPILCAGVATFNALKKCGAEPGERVAIVGIGGLGHMALQYARRMGFEVVAVGRGAAIAQDALELGAHRYLDARNEDAPRALRRMGGAAAIVCTVADPATVSGLVAGLAPRGRLVVLSAGKEAIAVAAGLLVGGERSVSGSITGTPCDCEKALNFSALTGARARIETMPLEEANAACERMRSGQATFRMVLTMAR